MLPVQGYSALVINHILSVLSYARGRFARLSRVLPASAALTGAVCFGVFAYAGEGPAATLATTPVVNAAAAAPAVAVPEANKAGMRVGAASSVPAASSAQRKTEATYKIIAGLDGEIFPVFANYASLRLAKYREFGTIAVRVTNSTGQPLRNRMTVQVPGWSDQEIQMVELKAGESRTILFAPTFLPRLYRNKEIAAATAVVSAMDMSGRIVFSETATLRMRSVDDIFWGQDFRYARFVASWVTPHDAQVEDVLSRAKEFMPHRRMPGYEEKKPIALVEKSTTMQAKAIYRALQERGVSYVKSSMTLGGHQDMSERVRMPGESLSDASANCIDGVVMYASLFENLGMDPVIVLVSGHAYVGVRLSPKMNDFLYIETSLTGRATFEAAVEAAQSGLEKVAAKDVIRVSVVDARVNGIFPMPGQSAQVLAQQVSKR